jgi:hypothetical protein
MMMIAREAAILGKKIFFRLSEMTWWRYVASAQSISHAFKEVVNSSWWRNVARELLLFYAFDVVMNCEPACNTSLRFSGKKKKKKYKDSLTCCQCDTFFYSFKIMAEHSVWKQFLITRFDYESQGHITTLTFLASYWPKTGHKIHKMSFLFALDERLLGHQQ